MTEKLPYFRQVAIPQHIKERYPNFVEFLKAYYEWLSIGPAEETVFTDIDGQTEIVISFRPLTNIRILVNGVEQEFTLDRQTGIATLLRPITSKWTQVTIIRDPNAGYAITNLKNIRDLDRTSDIFLEWFRETYLHNFPAYAFTNNFHQDFTFSVQNTIDQAFLLDCVCEADSIHNVIANGDTKAVDTFNSAIVRTVKWLVHVKEYTGRTSAYQVLAVAKNNSEVDYTIYSDIGSSISHTPSVDIVDGMISLKILNECGGILNTAIIRAPTFVTTNILVPNRSFMVNAPLTSRSVVKVYHNGVLVDGSYIIIGPNLNFCGEPLHEIRISESYPTPILVGDTVSIVVDERNKIDERLLIKNIQKVYASKGTEAATKLLFKLLYNEDIQIDYPNKRILKASDGKWDDEKKKIRITTNYELFDDGSMTDLLFRVIKINKWNFIFERYDVVATAVVERLEPRSAGGFSLVDLYLSNYQTFSETGFSKYGSLLDIDGDYKPNEFISCEFMTLDGDSISIQEQIVPTLDSVKIVSEGTGYSQGQRLILTSDFDYTIPFNWNGDPLIPHYLSANLSPVSTNARIVHYPTADLGSPVMNSPGSTPVINPPYLQFNGKNIEADTDPRLLIGDLIEIQVRSSDGYGAIGEVDGSGEIKRIDVYEAGIGYVSASDVSVSVGTGAILAVDDTDTLIDVPGRFIGFDGKLSSLPVLQDGRYYNPYTYVIKSGQQLEAYKQILIDLVHPAGFGVFGDMVLNVCLEMFIKSLTSSITFQPVESTNQDSTGDRANRALGPTYYSFDGRKFLYGTETNTSRIALVLNATDNPLVDTSLIGETIYSLSSPSGFGKVVGWIKEEGLLLLEPTDTSPFLPFDFFVGDTIAIGSNSPLDILGDVIEVRDVTPVSNAGNMTINEVALLPIEPFVLRPWSQLEYLPDAQINIIITRT